MSYEDDISIDEQALDVEWLDHPRRMMKYCEMAATTRRQMDLAKEELDAISARVGRSIRSDPEKYDLPKVTESALQSAILLDEEYQEASRAYIDAKYENDVAFSAVRAFEHRKSALENLVRLHGQSYFAGPTVPRNLAEERKMRDVAVQKNVVKRMRQK